MPPLPYLPLSSKNIKQYTLVLELDHTIIYYDRPNKMLKYRPYIDVFLNKLRDVF